jgi:hypothetical protein
MRRRALPLIHFLVFGVLLGLTGCSGNSGGRQRISGTVTVKGAPLVDGIIEFIPQVDSSPKQFATKSGALVRDGKYVIPKDKGLLPGTYKVIILAGGETAPEAAPGEPPGPTKKLPATKRRDYSQATKLVAEVTKEGPNQFDYTLP